MAYKPTQDYDEAFQSAVSRMRAGQARQRGQLAQSIASKGVRTSGVGLIPAQDLERGFSEAEAGLTGDFALEQGRAKVDDRRRDEDFSRELQLLERQGSLQDALERRRGLNSLRSGLVSGGIGAISSYYTGRR